MSDYIAPQLRNFDSGLARQERGGLGIANYFQASAFLGVVSRYAHGVMQQMISEVRTSMLPDDCLCREDTAERVVYPADTAGLSDARIILISREPRDVLASWRRSADTWAPWLNTDPKWVAEMISNYAEGIRQAPSLADADHLRVISYEDLYADPAAVLGSLGEFIGVPFTSDDIARAVAHAAPEAVGAGAGVSIGRYGAAAREYGPVTTEPDGFFGAARPGGSRHKMGLRDGWWMLRCQRQLRRRARTPHR